MKIVAINSLGYGSPAKIMNGILLQAENKIGAEVYSFYGAWGRKTSVPFSFQFGLKMESALAKYISMLTGYQHVWCFFSTKLLIKKIDDIKPDVIHLHNLHLWNINVPMLFKYIKKNNIKIIWTLHDCWSFTGQCPYFSEIKCEKWKTGCGKCVQLNRYPKTIVDRTAKMYQLKRKWFSGIKNMIIVTPSMWLKQLVQQSYLNKYPSICINNGIDINIFNPIDTDYKKRHNLSEKYIVLGVALEWGHRKGLDVFQKLANKLPDKYQIILVGIEKDSSLMLPKNILCISRTHNQYELAELYSAADVFLNPTREDNYPTVNLEALACGTPVITSKNGGSPETITRECGMVCDIEDINAVIKGIQLIVEEKCIKQEDCVKASLRFDAALKFDEYINLYKSYEMEEKI